MNINKVSAFAIAIATILLLLSGCSKNNTSDYVSTTFDANETSAVETTDKNVKDTTTSSSSAIQGNRSWVYKIDNANSITMGADYSTATNLIEHFSFHMEIDKDYPDYENMKAELQTYKFLIDKENDPKSIKYSYKENNDGSIVFDSHFYNLCDDDRASRAVLVLRFTGVTCNDDYLFNVNDVNSTLTTAGFETQ